MVTYGGITFNGKSGEKYYFKAWPLNTKFNPLGAVYFVTKRAFNDKTYRRASHQSIYIGQTADLTAPLALPTVWASHSRKAIAFPARNQTGGPSPTMSSSSAAASSGMMTKVVSGMAMRLAPMPYNPARWKW